MVHTLHTHQHTHHYHNGRGVRYTHYTHTTTTMGRGIWEHRGVWYTHTAIIPVRASIFPNFGAWHKLHSDLRAQFTFPHIAHCQSSALNRPPLFEAAWRPISVPVFLKMSTFPLSERAGGQTSKATPYSSAM